MTTVASTINILMNRRVLHVDVVVVVVVLVVVVVVVVAAAAVVVVVVVTSKNARNLKLPCPGHLLSQRPHTYSFLGFKDTQ